MLRVTVVAFVVVGCGGKVAADVEEAGTVLPCSAAAIDDGVLTKCPHVTPATRTARQTFDVFEADMRATLGTFRVSQVYGGDVSRDGTGLWLVVSCSDAGGFAGRASSSECTEIFSCSARCDPPSTFDLRAYVDSDVAVRTAFPSDSAEARYDIRLMTDPYASSKVSWLVQRRHDLAEHTVDAVTGAVVD